MNVFKSLIEFFMAPSIQVILWTAVSAVLGLLVTFFSGINVWWCVLIAGVLRLILQLINTKFSVGAKLKGAVGFAKK